MDIKRKYRKVFYDLYKSSNGLYAYTLYSRYNIQPSEVIEFINKYERAEIISVNDEQRIYLTHKGREELTSVVSKLVETDSIESSYVSLIKTNEVINLYEPYLPDRGFYESYLKERSETKASK